MLAFLRRLLCVGIAITATTARAQQPGSFDTSDVGQLADARAAMADHRWTLADGLLEAYLAKHTDDAGDADNSEALYLLGMTQFRENLPKDSLKTYTRAAKSRPPAAQDLRYVALDYVLLHDDTDADKWITRSVQVDRKDGESWYAMGRIKYTENRFHEAVDSFRQALMLIPHSVKAENNLGLAFEGLNRPEEAIVAYRQAISWQEGVEHPSEQPLLNLSILLTNRNELDEALPLLKKAEALAPGDGRIHEALGKLYARRAALPEARKEFEQAVKAEPDNAALHFQLGQIYRKQGLQAQAKKELARAAAIEGTHSSGTSGVD